jgi:hypothetical protein
MTYEITIYKLRHFTSGEYAMIIYYFNGGFLEGTWKGFNEAFLIGLPWSIS